MAMKFKETDYLTSKNILAIPEHYVAVGQVHNQRTVADSGVAVEVDDRWIVKAGTIFPSNDGNAKGVVLNDYDVTNGDVNMALVVHGFVKVSALPEAPTDEAMAKLIQVGFLDRY